MNKEKVVIFFAFLLLIVFLISLLDLPIINSVKDLFGDKTINEIEEEKMMFDNFVVKNTCEVLIYDTDNNFVDKAVYNENCKYDEENCWSLQISPDNSLNSFTTIVWGC